MENISPPALEGHERDKKYNIVLKDLVCIGSYDRVDSPKPAAIVRG